MDSVDIMKAAIEKAKVTMRNGEGGPFGAAIVTPDGKVYASSNTVLGSKDPTAHAEVNAIRLACKEMGTHNLEGCVLYTTCYPCPMCMGAAIWANIKEIWYGSTAKDAAAIGFRDDYIYDFIEHSCKDEKVMKIKQAGRELTIKLFEEYSKEKKEMY